MRYDPLRPASDPADLLEQNNLRRQLSTAQSALVLQYLGVLPAYPKDGLYLFAAGIAGANRGAYRYDSLSHTYTFLA